jgi:carbon monoxide dehydrogenase subunit G
MNMAGEQRIAAPRQRVWQALNDPEILRASIPGCQSLEKTAEDRFTATVAVKLGPIGARFKGAVSLTDLNPPNGYTLILEGNGGIAGSVKGRATVRLSEAGGGTVISHEVEIEVGGRLAQLGGPIIDATGKQLAGRFFTRLGEIVCGAAQPAETGEAVAREAVAGEAVTSVGATTAELGAVATFARPAPSGGFPIAWILATVIAALVGFLIGRGQGTAASDWAGLAIGLLLIVVAGAAFEYGRRAAAPVVMLDRALLRRLLEGARE